ncbi:hypothetical protein JTB14_024566 [Gonioctena quinquepunctata]|nr:hypothetical protein JTB14_024566 [Gonioctena quinquepunctata]
MRLFTEDELRAAAECLKSGKAPAEAIKIAAKTGWLLGILNQQLTAIDLPKQWKVARLEDPSAYRPLCLLCADSKLYAGLIGARLRQAIEESGGLSRNQYGFRKGYSTWMRLRQ